jgi:hypothetical protein
MEEVTSYAERYQLAQAQAAPVRFTVSVHLIEVRGVVACSGPRLSAAW